MNQPNTKELWAYDEPHESGGNCHVTMTRRQAIDWMRRAYPAAYRYGGDNEAFLDWCALHFASPGECEWTLNEAESDSTVLFYDTRCGQQYNMMKDGVEKGLPDEKCRFCPGCGRPIQNITASPSASQ